MTNFYKQKVYEPSDYKIGGVDDNLIDKEGRVTAVIMESAGSSAWAKRTWLFPSAQFATNGNWFSTRTRRLLKTARGFTYDKAKTTWIPAENKR